MFLRASSFEACTTLPRNVGNSLRLRANALGLFDAAAGAQKGGAVIFTSGKLSSQQHSLMSEVAEQCPGLPVLIAGGVGVSSERGEILGPSGATGLVWRGGKVDLEAIDVQPELFGSEVQCLLGTSGSIRSALLFVRPGGYTPSTVQQLAELPLSGQLFGGGCQGDPGVLGVSADGQFVEGRAVVMSMAGPGVPNIQTAHSCQLLEELKPITQLRGSMVLEIGGEPALELLARLGKQLEGQPLMQVVLEAQGKSEGETEPGWVIRGISGIDPVAGGLLVSEEPCLGQRMGFAVQDASAARKHLKDSCRKLERQLAGAAPLCSIYLQSALRSRQLYGRDNVDCRLIAEQFSGIPSVGIQTPFEISPIGDSSSFQVFSGVLALFSALS